MARGASRRGADERYLVGGHLTLVKCVGLTIVAAAALLFSATLAPAAPRSTHRAGAGPCREAINGLVSMLDAKTDNTALYRDTYRVVVDTCGPAAPAPKPVRPPPSRDSCRDLAAAMVDLIEDGKMNTPAFVKARTAFAQACAPR
jgi:hypothetical protein